MRRTKSCRKMCKHIQWTRLYRSFILPQLDYADVIWDNCSIKLAEELESVHLDAIKTIIGAVRGTSH